MSTHPVLAAHPAWQEHQAKVAGLRRREESVRKQILAAQAEFAEKQQKHDVAFAKAVQTGGTLPAPPPPMPDGYDRALAMLRDEDEALRAEGAAVMAEIAPELEQATRDRNQVAMAKVATLGRSLERERDEVQQNLRFVAEVRASVDRANPDDVVRPTLAARTRTALTYDDLLAFAEFDGDPLAPEPLPPSAGRIVKDDGKDEAIMMRRHDRQFTVQQQVKTFGLDTAGVFGVPPPMAPRPDTRRRGEI